MNYSRISRETITCRVCHRSDELNSIYYNYKGNRRLSYYICRGCSRDANHYYWEISHDKRLAYYLRYEQRNRDKRRIRDIAKRSVPIQPCEICGTSVGVHRHHDDYSKPLEVKFLCPLHHKQYHLSLKEN